MLLEEKIKMEQEHRNNLSRDVLEEFLGREIEENSYFKLQEEITKLANEKNRELYRLVTILEKYNYGDKPFIVYALSSLKRPFYRDLKEKIEFLPYIKEAKISIEEDLFLLNTHLGEFYIEKPLSYLEDKNPLTAAVLSSKDMKRNCHDRSLELSQLSSYEAVTSICNFSFGSKILHSYNTNREDHNCIDLAQGFVLRKENYQFLMQPEVISSITKENYQSSIINTEQYFDNDDRTCKLLKIAYTNYEKSFTR